ncbi:small subunit ribosomal protein S14e [Pancytospora philotis]|nr:small subunit ribosomal protein S14e [Pancytospora philotis]
MNAEVEVPVQEVAAEAPQAIVQERLGICFILSTKNNTIVTITDLTGRETFAKFTGGMKVKSKKDEGSPYAAIQAAQDAADKAIKCGITVCNIKVRARGGIKRRNLGPGAQSAIRTFISSGIKVGRIECVTPIPTDGCRKKGGHRGRRV